MVAELYRRHGDVETLDLRDRRWSRGDGELFFAESQGANAVDAIFVDERGAFFLELAAGVQEGEAGGKGNISVDLVPEFTGESEQCGWHGW